MKIYESLGTVADATDLIEPILVVNITGQMLNQNKTAFTKIWAITSLLLTLSDQFKYDLNKDLDFICAKRHLASCVYNN
jgi:hypothetical protein